MKTKVILLADIQNLGRKGEIKHISRGYVRNYLIPKKLVRLATYDALEELEQQVREHQAEATQDLLQAQDLVAQLDGVSVTIVVKANETGTVYDSVTSRSIAKALRSEGFSVKETQVVLQGPPIKRVGEYVAVVAFEHGLEAQIKVVVERKEE